MDCEGVILGKMYQARSLDRVVDDIQLILTSKRKEKKRKKNPITISSKGNQYSYLYTSGPCCTRLFLVLFISSQRIPSKGFSRPTLSRRAPSFALDSVERH